MPSNRSQRPKPTNDKAPPTGAGVLRIIGGQWRGSKLHFPQVAALRPTPDRVRETLFNWLQHEVVDARCLDLFAGSGALGLEALSRGAAHATFVDTDASVVRYLRETLTRLHCQSADVHHGAALTLLHAPTAIARDIDIVFLDPPFAAAEHSTLLAQLFAALLQPGCLSANSCIYLECPASMGAPDQWPYWPGHWLLSRSKQAGQVGYHLARQQTG